MVELPERSNRIVQIHNVADLNYFRPKQLNGIFQSSATITKPTGMLTCCTYANALQVPMIQNRSIETEGAMPDNVAQ